jgi:hypothetical protein
MKTCVMLLLSRVWIRPSSKSFFKSAFFSIFSYFHQIDNKDFHIFTKLIIKIFIFSYFHMGLSKRSCAQPKKVVKPFVTYFQSL